VNYYEHHLGDYAEATAHLSFIEDAAYSRLMRKVYATELPLPADIKSVQRLVGARSKDERDAVAVVLEEFFVLGADGWHNDRCDIEISKYQKKAEKNREVGKLGGRPRKTETMVVIETEPKNNHGGLFSEPKHNPPQSPVPSNQLNTPSPPKGDDPFDEFWKAYPNKTGKDAARKAFDKRKPGKQLLIDMLEAIEAQKQSEQWRKQGGQFIPNPSTWLNQGRWQDGETMVDQQSETFV